MNFKMRETRLFGRIKIFLRTKFSTDSELCKVPNTR